MINEFGSGSATALFISSLTNVIYEPGLEGVDTKSQHNNSKSSCTSKARFFFTSKFGETVGAAGGVATTTLQQAYNNSSEPEITTNSILNALVIKNGTGNADNVSNLFEGQNTAGTVTSFIRADGAFSGTSMYVTGITATTISATTIYANGGNVVTKISSGIDSTGNTTTGSYQLVQSVLIPANTIKNGDVVLFKARYRKVGANAAANYRITVNTTLNLTGAQIVGQFNSGLTILYLELSRTAAVKGGTTEVFNTSVTNVQDDVTQSTIAVTNLTIDWTINQYVMYSILNSSASDTTFVSYYSITEI